jgi:hypothetical protein
MANACSDLLKTPDVDIDVRRDLFVSVTEPGYHLPMDFVTLSLRVQDLKSSTSSDLPHPECTVEKWLTAERKHVNDLLVNDSAVLA